MAHKPIYMGRHTIFHGFGRRDIETSPGVQPATWWGSSAIHLPEGTQETVVRLQAEDGGHCGGILYRRGGERTVVVFSHPRADFANHYLIPALLGGGYAAFGGQTRHLGNDIALVHEHLIPDLAAQIQYLRAVGFQKVVLCGNSGGGPLSTFYLSQAATRPPHRLMDTPAGDPYDLNTLDLPLGDGLVLVAAAVSEGVLGLENLDPSVTDEHDPLSHDPALDMFNPANGYREPPRRSAYAPEFLRHYREAQRARCARIDAMARQDIARRRRYRTEMGEPRFTSLPFEERLHITRMASAQTTLTIYRTAANPAVTDLSISPSKREVNGLMTRDPLAANWGSPGFVSVMTPEAWLSTWSGLSSRVNLYEDIKKVESPVLIINFEADVAILPHEAEGYYKNAATEDKALAHIEAGHFPGEAAILATGAVINSWLSRRFPGR